MSTPNPIPNSRQPVLHLPAVMPDGKRTKQHPFLWALKNRMPLDMNKSDIARRLGVRPQSLYKWERACAADRNFPLPILRASQFADVFNVPASIFRPDVQWGANQ